MNRGWPVFAVSLATLIATGCTKVLGDFVFVPPDASVDPTPVADADAPDAIDDAPAGACSPGMARCAAGSFREVCRDDRNWARDGNQPCPYLCVEGMCVGECKPGVDMRCDPDKYFERCNSDALFRRVNFSDAGTPVPCSYLCTKTGCSACLPDDRRCVSDDLQTCNSNGQWVPPLQPCPAVCTGTGADTRCGGVCKPGPTARRCGGDTGNQPQRCSAEGEWVDDGPVCVPNCTGLGMCGGLCTNDTKQCLDRSPQTCVGGLWVTALQPCPFGCTDGTCTGSCVPGVKQCFGGNTVQTCEITGSFGQPQACAFVCGAVGDAGQVGCTGECVPGSFTCRGQDQLSCNPQGRWTTLQTCTLGCVMDGCAVCTPGSKRCTSTGAPQVCDPTGHWIANGSCANGCADGGVCSP